MDYKEHIRTIENFPKPGIHFYDISTLIGNGAVFASMINEMAEPLEGKVDKIVGLDARGFVFGAAIAAQLETGFVMLRKPGKLPGETVSREFDLEYGSTTIEMQKDALTKGETVAIVDDVIATGGTAEASVELIKESGANIYEFTSAIDLPFLDGSERIKQHGVQVRSIVTYDS